MKRSRSESHSSSSSSGDDNSDSDTSTISSHDSSESEKRSPKSNCVKNNNQTSSNRSKQGSSTSSSSSSKWTASPIVASQTKRSQYSSDKNAQQISQTVSKKIKNGNLSYASPTKGSKAALPKKKQIIDLIDSSASEYSPSDDENGTESSSSSESENENEKHQTKETSDKKAKHVVKNEMTPEVSKKPKIGNSHHQKHTPHTQKGEGKRFSREEDAAIIAYIENIVRTVDLMKHLRETFPDQPPRAQTSVRYRRASLFEKWKELILSTEASKRH